MTTVLRSKVESEYVWIKLNKAFLNMSSDYYVCFVYASPAQGREDFGIDVYDRIMKDIDNYNSKGNCLIMGDLNAHTGIEPDYVVQDYSNNNLFQIPDSYKPDIPLRRNSDHSKINEHGKALLDLCVSSGFRILNGRKIGKCFETVLILALCPNNLP